MATLVIFGHTFWNDSKVNKALLESISVQSDITIHNLSEVYKDFKINSKTEIELLQKADSIVFQFPLFWFSTPSILKEWQDVVLSAILYGSNPELLKNKKFGIVTTAGGAEGSYDGHHGATLRQMLTPIYESFKYLGTNVRDYYCIFETHSLNPQSLPIDAYKKYLLG